MNIYIHVSQIDNRVTTLVKETDPDFPNVPVEDRYSADFLSQCVVRTEEQVEEQGITTGMVYDADTDSFSEYISPEHDPEPEPEEGYSVTQEEVDAAYREGVNDVE